MGRRQRAQERAKREYEASYGKPKPPPSDPPSGSGGSAHVWGIAAIVIGIAGGIGWYFLKERVNKSAMLSQRGEPRGSLVVGSHIVLVDSVSVTDDSGTDTAGNPTSERIYNTRLTVLDAATGKESARALVEGLDGCKRATDDRLWCAVSGGLHLYALADLRELLVVDKAVPGKPVPGIWQIDGGAAIQLLTDGSAAKIDPATLAVTRMTEVPRALQPDITGRRRPGSLATVETSCDPTYLHNASMMQTIAKAKAGWMRDGDHLVKGKRKTATLLDPELLGEDLVIHRSSLDPDEGTLRLSRLRDDGTLAWTAELDAPTCENAMLAGSTYAVTTKSSKARARAIDLETGAIRWHLP